MGYLSLFMSFISNKKTPMVLIVLGCIVSFFTIKYVFTVFVEHSIYKANVILLQKEISDIKIKNENTLASMVKSQVQKNETEKEVIIVKKEIVNEAKNECYNDIVPIGIINRLREYTKPSN